MGRLTAEFSAAFSRDLNVFATIKLDTSLKNKAINNNLGGAAAPSL